MTETAWALPALVGAIALGLLLFAEARGMTRLKGPAKMVASGAFVWGGWMVHHGPSRLEAWMLAALMLSAVGDAFLISRDQRAFLKGLIAFLLAHVAYCMAFWVGGVDTGAATWSGMGAGLVCAGAGVVLLPKVSRSLRIPVVIYMVVICCMVALAVGSGASGRSLWFPMAAFAFLFSDLAVGLDRFVQSGFTHRVWGLPLYFGAQWLFVLGMAAG